jgi:hypothetical protein
VNNLNNAINPVPLNDIFVHGRMNNYEQDEQSLARSAEFVPVVHRCSSGGEQVMHSRY